MEGIGASRNAFMRRRRSATARRPRPDSQFTLEGRDASPPSSTPSSDNASKLSPEDSAGHDASFRRKEFNLNGSGRRIASVNKTEGLLAASKKLKKNDKKFGDLEGFYRDRGLRGGISGNVNHRRTGSELKRCSEGALAPANWKGENKVKESLETPSRSADGYAGKRGDGHNVGGSVGTPDGSAENKLKKVKLKVGGVTRTIHAKSNLANEKNSSSSAKPARSSDASRRRQRLILQDTSDDDYPPPEKGNGLQGAPPKDFGGGGFSRGAKDNPRAKVGEESPPGKQTDMPHSIPFSEPVRKSKRVPKRRVLDGEFDDGNGDGEMHYPERLKTSKATSDHSGEQEDDGEDSIKKKKASKVSKNRKCAYDVDDDYGLSQPNKDSKRKSRTARESDDTDYVEEEEPGSDGGSDAKRKKQKKEPVNSSIDVRSEPLTTRQRALQSGKGVGESLIEFPNGLPPAPPRKQKEKLSEVEQQARKAEAAQRRRMQVEKAARESEAEAIRKILGQDSSRKKKEEKIRKERDEMAQKKATESLILGSNTIRWVMGPTGTVVTFGDDVGLPSIFNSKQCSYPPLREKCAGPSCTNAYKYRDSKSNLPLCSLQCYKAVKERAQPVSTC